MTSAMSGPDADGVQRVLRDLWSRECYCSLNYLITELARVVHHIPYTRDSDINDETIHDLLVVRPSYEEVAREHGWTVVPWGNQYVPCHEDEPKPGEPHPVFEVLSLEGEDRLGAGWYWQEKGDTDNSDGPFDSATLAWYDLWEYHLVEKAYDDEEEAWEAICNDQDYDTTEYEREVYEHYAVSDFMARKLQEVGEKVVEFCGFNVWCRTCTGQSVVLDHCLYEVGRRMEILPGQANDWSAG
jgi:hypothetical protein